MVEPAPGPSVLFVDDDPAVLAGLRRLLRIRRVPGCLYFADSVEDARSVLSATRIDGVVTDMRMPGTDGAALLEEVRSATPSALRVVLSGQTDPSAAVRAAGVAHRFLDKPAEPDALLAVLASLGELARCPLPDAVRDGLGGLSRLPGGTRALSRLEAALAAPAPRPDELAAAAGGDLAVVAKLVQLASSAFLAPPALPRSEADLFAHVGADDLRILLAAGALATPAEDPATDALAADLAERARQGLRRVEAVQGGDLPPAALLGAALRGLGVLAARRLGAVAAGVDPRALARYLLSLWGVSAEVVAAIDAPPRREPAARRAASASGDGRRQTAMEAAG